MISKRTTIPHKEDSEVDDGNCKLKAVDNTNGEKKKKS